MMVLNLNSFRHDHDDHGIVSISMFNDKQLPAMFTTNHGHTVTPGKSIDKLLPEKDPLNINTIYVSVK